MGGCAAQEQGTASSAELDERTLEIIAQQDQDLANSGYRLEGRIWSSKDAFTSIYKDKNGSRTFVGGSKLGSEAPAAPLPQPEAEEDFWTYVERVRPSSGYRPVLDGSNEVFFFDKSASAPLSKSEVRDASQAVVGQDDYCDRANYNVWKNWWMGYNNSATSLLSSWDRKDIRKADTDDRKSVVVNGVTATYSAVCVDKGTVTQTVQHSNSKNGITIPENYTVELQQGWAWYFGSIGGRRHFERCVNKYFFGCVDYRWFIEFASFDVRSSIAPATGAEAHFSGVMSKTGEIDDGDQDCRLTAVCPVNYCYPGQCPRP